MKPPHRFIAPSVPASVSASVRASVLTLALALLALAAPAPAHASDEFFDDLRSALTTQTHDGAVRARVSGTLDLEAHRLPHPNTLLLDTTRDTFLVPRLSLFLDAQLGPHVYAFVQGRADRGFDGADGSAHYRLDEYALRFTPSRTHRAGLQLGKFATLVGNWVARHGSWENPFVSAPLPYENLTAVWDREPARTVNQFLNWAHVRNGLSPAVAAVEKKLRLPLIWGPAYGSGAAASAALGPFTFAAEVKTTTPAARPSNWPAEHFGWSRPALAARLGWSPGPMWRLGLSGSTGRYLVPAARALVVPGIAFADYRQRLLAADLDFAWHHWRVSAELMHARFHVPLIGEAATTAAYAEAKYKVTPRFAAALRLNRQFFGAIPDGSGGLIRWGRDVWRLDLAPSFRFTPNLQLKLEAGLQQEAAPTALLRTRTLAAQFTIRF